MKRLLIVCALMVLTTWAFAHENYPPECCTGKDCIAVPCDQIEHLGEQRWRHGKVDFGMGALRKPIDERCHVCEWGAIGRCIFFPMPSMS